VGGAGRAHPESSAEPSFPSSPSDEADRAARDDGLPSRVPWPPGLNGSLYFKGPTLTSVVSSLAMSLSSTWTLEAVASSGRHQRTSVWAGSYPRVSDGTIWLQERAFGQQRRSNTDQKIMTMSKRGSPCAESACSTHPKMKGALVRDQMAVAYASCQARVRYRGFQSMSTIVGSMKASMQVTAIMPRWRLVYTPSASRALCRLSAGRTTMMMIPVAKKATGSV
jgi:hypothetical protein